MARLSHLVAMMEGQTISPTSAILALASPADAAAALAWLVQAGVDSAVEAVPRRWLEAAPPLPAVAADRSPAPAPIVRVVTDPAVHPAVDAVARARAAPLTAANLAELDTALRGFDHGLRRSDLAAQLVIGNTDSRVLVLCDQPEAEASAAAVLRTRMLAAIGLDASNSALLHRIPWPMPGGRSPTPAELAAFAPFADRALAIIRPRAVLALGERAAGLAGDAMARASARGRWADLAVADATVPLLATCHPRLLLDQPLRKREAWADLQAFAARLAVTK